MRVWCYRPYCLFFNCTTSHNGNLGLMSESRMRIRVVKATAVVRLLRGTVSPSESRDVKRREREEGGRGELVLLI